MAIEPALSLQAQPVPLTAPALALLVLVLVLLLGVCTWLVSGCGRLPGELRRAELVFAEKLFRGAGVPTITARVDRVYRRRDGVLVLLELKTRARPAVFVSDVIALSAQRVALHAALGQPVARHGYVLIQAPDGRALACRRVHLWSMARVAALAERRRLLLSGRITPKANGSPHLCSGCAQRERCSARGG